MRKNKLFLLLALLLTAATGAWAQEPATTYSVKKLTVPNTWTGDMTTFSAADLPSDFAAVGDDVVTTIPAPTATGNVVLIYGFSGGETKYVEYANGVQSATDSRDFPRDQIYGYVNIMGYEGVYYTAAAGTSAGYTVSLKDGVKDADKWTVKVGEGQAQALPIGGLKGDGSETVTLQYTGRLKVKGVKATSEAPAPSVTEVTTFSELQAALSAGKDVKLMNDIDCTAEINITSGALTIDGNGKTLSTTSAIRAFKVGSSATVAFKNLILTGFVSGGGPAINNSGTIVLDGCTISNCHVNNTNGGGAIENKGSSSKLYAINTTFSGNYSGEIGGAINNYRGSLYMSGCTFTNNYTTQSDAYYGGAIGINGGDEVRLINCTFSENKYGTTTGASDIGVFNKPENYTIAGCTGATIASGDGNITTNATGTATLDYSDLSNIAFTVEQAEASVPDGALSGKFSVSDGKQVYFSKGNLRYESSKWSFFDNQYDYYNSYSADAWDHFGWSTSAPTYGMNTSTVRSDYSGDFVDWGATMGTGWRMLTSDEWTYLLKTRSASTVGGTENGRYAKAKVNNVRGVILFPDTYTHPDGVTAPTGVNATGDTGWNGNSYTAEDWTKMETAGCVFLPAAGYRNGSNVNNPGSVGDYSSATPSGTEKAYELYFSSGSLNTASEGSRFYGLSVRLVSEVATSDAPAAEPAEATYTLLSAATTADCGKVVCAAGHLHDAKTAVPDGCTAVGILGKVTETGHGLIIALQDATSQDWNTINGWTSVTTYAGTTLKVLPDDAARGTNLTSYTALGSTAVSNWAVGGQPDYMAIFKNLGGAINEWEWSVLDNNVNAYITTGVGGSALDGEYWTAWTTEELMEGDAIMFSINDWNADNTNNSKKIRPVLGFGGEAAAAKEAATVTTAPTGAAIVGVGKTTALVSGGAAEGGTMMYKVTTENTKPASTDGFSEAVPTAQGITASGTVYVWYYVKGDDTHSDSEIAATAIEVPVADIVWDITNVSGLNVSGTYTSYEKEGITLSGNGEEVFASWSGNGNPETDGIRFDAMASGGYTFTAPTGKAFTKIEMKALGIGGWDMANLGDGWAFNADWETNNFTATWTGSAASAVGLLTGAGEFQGDKAKYIAFYLSDVD